MVITTDTRLKIKKLLTDMFHGQNMTDQSKIDYAIDRVCLELENRPMSKIRIDDGVLNGAEIAVAMLFTGPSKPEEIDGKKYMTYNDDYISIFASHNFAKLLRCSVPISRPNGWGDEEDWIQHPPIYTTATCRDMDGIYDTMYYC